MESGHQIYPFMARPVQMKKGRSTRLYLPDDMIRRGSKLAFQRGESLSAMVRRLLQQAIDMEEAGRKPAVSA